MTAGENIGIGRVTQIGNHALVVQTARKSGVDRVIFRLDKCYDTMLGHWFEQVWTLNGGEWQKIARARAFMCNAPILLSSTNLPVPSILRLNTISANASTIWPVSVKSTLSHFFFDRGNNVHNELLLARCLRR